MYTKDSEGFSRHLTSIENDVYNKWVGYLELISKGKKYL